jgi:hypothetical protein
VHRLVRKFFHEQLAPSWIATPHLRTAIPAVVAAASIAISFFNPSLALRIYWLLLAFHFLPGHLPPAVKG